MTQKHSPENDGEGAGYHVLAASEIKRLSFGKCLGASVNNSEFESNDALAKALGIAPSYLGKFLSNAGGIWGKRLVSFMQVTKSIAPLQWLADQLGCDVVPRETDAARVDAIANELAQLVPKKAPRGVSEKA